MPAIKLLPREASIIKTTLPSGKEVEIDALDLDDLVRDAVLDEVFHMEVFLQLFFQKYGEAVSKVSVNALLDMKHQIFEEIKKNSSVSLDPTAVSNPDQSVNETSNSSD